MSKRPRNVSGPGTSSTSTQEIFGILRERDSKSASAQSDELRRRSAKQNREIIAINVKTQLALASVQAEVFTLRAEILSVRQRNMVLCKELRKRSQAQIQSPPIIDSIQRQSIEAILAAVPALQTLLAQTTVNVSPPTPQSDPDWLKEEQIHTPGPPPTACQMPLIFTSRPAQIAKAIKDKGLGPLTEDVEDYLVDSAITSHTTHPSGLNTTLSARIPKPLPSTVVAVAKSPLLSSPSSRASPRRKSRGGEKARRRRESGLLQPIGPPRSPEKDLEENISGELDGDAEGRARDEEAVLDLIGADERDDKEPKQRIAGGENARAGKSQELHLGFGMGVPSQRADIDGISSEETRPSHSVSEEIGDEGGSEGGNGGRGRRSRNSVVSYKEPSLNKKMRKPDGTPIDDIIKSSTTGFPLPSSGNTASLSSSTSSTDSIPNEDLPYPVPSTLPPKPRQPIPSASMRRKSTLPRQGNRRGGRISDVIQSDNECEDIPADDTPKTVRRSRSIPSLKTETIDTDNAPPLPALAPAPISNRIRTSPRKSPSKSQALSARSGSTSILSRPIPNSGSRRQVGVNGDVGVVRQRDPLVDRNDNGQGRKGFREGTGDGLGVVKLGNGIGGDGSKISV